MKAKRMRYIRKKIFVFLFLFLFLLGLGVGYALVYTDLEILGIAGIKAARWDVHLDNYNLETGSVIPESNPTVTDTSVSFAAKLTSPGDYYEFTIDVENEGTIPAVLNSLTVTPDFSSINYIESTITYDDGTAIQSGDVLLVGATRTIKVKLNYKDGLNDTLYPSTDQSYNVTIALGYQQFAGDVPDFEHDSWASLIEAYNDGDPSGALKLAMKQGTTREVLLDLDNNPETDPVTAHVRIANLSKLPVCETQGFSQTACGFVIEFVESITTRRMNPEHNWTNGTGSFGGWEYSDMRAYLNSGVYTKENIDYTSTGLFNALPSDLKAEGIIKDTVVVSGYGKNDENTGNYITTDKIYLLDVKEILGPTFTYVYNRARDAERQLDYYELKGVTENNISWANKKYLNNTASSYWTRTAYSNVYNYYFGINYGDRWGSRMAQDTIGVSPAFRIAY